MRIEQVRTTERDGWAAIEAEVVYEDASRPARTVYFSTPHAASLGPRPADALLTGVALAALHHGERRVCVESPVDPLLLENLRTVVAFFNRWFYNGDRGLTLEAPAGEVTPREGHVGAFFSGGIDSLFTVFHNHRTLPPGHPSRVREGLVMLGFEMRTAMASAEQKYARVLESLAPVARELDIELVPIASNVRELEPDGDFWGDVFQGGILAAAAHALSGRYAEVLIAASVDVAQLRPYGTHPAVDPSFSSGTLALHHRDVRFTRLEKLAALRDGGVSLDTLRICSRAPADRLNCGRCEKCVRVRLALMAIGTRESEAFDPLEVSTPEVDALPIDASVAPFYPELVPALAQTGHVALARAVKNKLWRDLPRRTWDRVEDALKDVDHALLGDRLRRAVRRGRGHDS